MSDTLDYLDQTRGLADRNPALAVVRAFGQLQVQLALVEQQRLPATVAGPADSVATARRLDSDGVITSELRRLIEELAKANDAVLAGNATPLPTDAERYAGLVDQAISQLRQCLLAA